jgi:hypothetical protein
LIYFSRVFDPLVLSHGYQYVASFIFAFWMLIIGGFIFSYGIATFNVGNTLSYIILRKKKDDENLLERKDDEEMEDEDAGENADEESKTGEETEKDVENESSDES